MKYIIAILILSSGLFSKAEEQSPRVLENDHAKVTLSLHERASAEPVNKPREIRVKVECKKGFKQKKKEKVITVCNADLQSADVILGTDNVQFTHFDWDAVKSSNNLEGSMYCDNKKPIKDTLTLSEFCIKK